VSKNKKGKRKRKREREREREGEREREKEREKKKDAKTIEMYLFEDIFASMSDPEISSKEHACKYL